MNQYLHVIIALFVAVPASCQVSGEKGFYAQDEIVIELNGYNVATPFDREMFLSQVGDHYTEFINTDSNFLLEFGYNIYEYRYKDSSVIINDEWGISDIQIRDSTLSINGIRVGDSIEKIRKTFARYHIRDNRITIFYAGSSLSFYHNSEGIITTITFFVPT